MHGKSLTSALAATLLLVTSSLTARAGAHAGGVTSPPPEGAYMLGQLARLTATNWARVAGADTGLPPMVNGHDEFVSAWTKEMLHDLHGLPVGVLHQRFTPSGFEQDPPKKPAMNVLVVVPGVQHPDQTVVIGAHPDGEPWSKGSAFDDASGCVIMLGLARVLGNLWRQNGLPARTVEFALFDAEEQGLDGSIAYGFNLRHGALLPRPVFMIDEEQSGIGYPARPFGSLAAAPMPSFAITTPAQPANDMGPYLAEHIRHGIGAFTTPPESALQLAQSQILAARSDAFSDLRRTYGSITYNGGSAPAFQPSDEGLVQISANNPGGSDNQPFEALGLPTVTFAGDSAYGQKSAPDWAYPFDQPEDTLTAMACDTGGSPRPGTALAAALDLEVAMSYSLVQAYAPAESSHDTLRLTIVSSTFGAGAPAKFEALDASRSALSPSWKFDDGGRASGSSVEHTFHRIGRYTVTVTVGRTSVVQRITVSKRQPFYVSDGRGYSPPRRKPWSPPELQEVAGC